MEIMKNKGASNCILAIPTKEQGMSLNRREFTDAINLRYYRELRGPAQICACGQKFNTTHTLNCKKRGFVHMRHDGVRDFLILSGLLNTVQINTEAAPSGIRNTDDQARLDINAKGF